MGSSLEIWGPLRLGPPHLGQLGEVNQLADLHLCIGPSRNLYDHVQNGLLLIGVQWDVVEG